MTVEIRTPNAQIVKALKNILQEHNVLDRTKKITKKDSEFCITCVSCVEEVSGLISQFANEISFIPIDEKLDINFDRSLYGLVTEYLIKNLHPPSEFSMDSLISKVPKRWSIYPPLVLFNSGTFDADAWTHAFQSQIHKNDFFKHIVQVFPGKVTHLAINKPIIEEDVMRRPLNLVPLWGDFGPEPTEELISLPNPLDLERAFWCTAIQNGIQQTWAPRYTMFSRGNIKEKKRILESFRNLEGTNVLDLYAGIGYFTLSYLANGATVFCWEINPWSIEGLRRGLKINKHNFRIIPSDRQFSMTEYEDALAQGVRVFVFHESNENAPTRLSSLRVTDISHVNLGLLPSLKPSWQIARDTCAVSRVETTVHVHENVHKDQFSELLKEVLSYYNGFGCHLETVKTFAPDVWHVVVDVKVKTKNLGK